jgi:hypothetical protein
MIPRQRRLLARSILVSAVAAGLVASAALVGCELAVNPDVGLAEVPAPTCLPCLDASETVITEPDGNVVIVPIDSLDGGDDTSAVEGDDAADGDIAPDQ